MKDEDDESLIAKAVRGAADLTAQAFAQFARRRDAAAELLDLLHPRRSLPPPHFRFPAPPRAEDDGREPEELPGVM